MANGKLLERSPLLRGRRWVLQNPAGTKAASLLTHFALGFVTGCVRIFGDCGPFGAAMTARAGGGLGGVFCMLGAVCGYVVSGGFSWALRYAAALLLIYTVSFLTRERAVIRREWFMPAAASGIMLLTGALNAFETIVQLSVIVALITETVLCALSAYLFQMALTSRRLMSEEEELRRRAGGALLLCCLMMALARVTLFRTVCLGRVLAVFCVMVAAYGGGASSGAAIGVIAGLAMDFASGGAPFFTLCYGFAGVIAGSLKRQGRLMFLLIFIAADTLTVFWNWGEALRTAALFETFAASVLFMLLPAKGMALAVSAVQKPSLGSGETGYRRYTAQRTGELADAFRELYETVRRSAESTANDADIATVYDRAAEAVCAECRHKGECWQRDYMDTLTVLNDATEAMKKRGHLRTDDLPERFREHCPTVESFTAAVNMELRALIYRRQLKARLEENRSAAYGQYRYLAGVLDAVAEELGSSNGPDTIAERKLLRYLQGKEIDANVSVFRDRSGRLRAVVESSRLSLLYREENYMDKLSETLGVRMCRPAGVNREDGRLVLLEAEPLAVSVGVAALKKEGESVSGDRGTYFKTEQGVLCVLLSDGMGSGEEAAKESISSVRILERFLRSGVEPGTAMKLLNSVMLLKNGDGWGYATIDLMCIDLFTGRTGFYKYGAAPSYIRSGKTVRRVRGVSMAAGILAEEGEAPDVVRMHLKPGGVALIASDGVVSPEDDAWLRQMLAEYGGGDTREFARSVIREAGKLNGYSDDMTVLAVRVEERK